MTCAVCSSEDLRPFLTDLRDYQFGTDRMTEIRQCGVCGTVQQYPMPTQDEALAFYPEEYAHYHPDTSQLRQFLISVYFRNIVGLLGRLGCGPGSRLLDIGAGCGEKAAHLRRALGADVTCVEPNPKGAAAARDVFGLTTINGFFPNEDIPPGSFDFVYINHVIEHVPDPVALLNDIHEVLVPGGWIFGETENLDSLSYRVFGRYWSLLHTPYHLFFFNDETLPKVFERSSFSRPEMQHDVDPSAWVLSTINYLRRNQKHLRAAQSIPFYKLFLVAAVPIAQLERPKGPILRFWAQKKT